MSWELVSGRWDWHGDVWWRKSRLGDLASRRRCRSSTGHRGWRWWVSHWRGLVSYWEWCSILGVLGDEDGVMSAAGRMGVLVGMAGIGGYI